MRLTINFKDDILDELEALATRQRKPLEKLISDNLLMLASIDPKDHNITLSGKQVGEIQGAMGGKTFSNADELVRAVKECFRVGLDGTSKYTISIEDMQLLKEQYQGYEDWLTFDEFVANYLDDALSLYMHGMVKAKVAYK